MNVGVGTQYFDLNKTWTIEPRLSFKWKMCIRDSDVPYQGCMAIDAGDRNRVKNILFEDIRVESIQKFLYYCLSFQIRIR